MANTIPCPNPVCAHQFGLAELQAAAQLVCPKCGFRMQGKGPAKAPPAKPPAAAPPKPKPAPKLATPIAAPPKLATPVQAAPPLATPIAAAPNPFAISKTPTPPAPPPPINSEESIPEGAFFNPDVGGDAGALVRTAGKAKRKFNWMKLLIMLFAVGFAASIVIAALTGVVILFLGKAERDPFNSGAGGSIFFGQVRTKEGNEKVYKLALPKEEWEIDKEVRSRFEAEGSLVSAWKNKQDYDFWFVVVVKDYGVFKPRDAEMLRIGIDKLESVFGDALEVGKKAEPAKIGDRAAQKIEFKGQIKAAGWNGECYMFFNNGIAYWLYLASPDKSVVEFFADELPAKNFFIESERRGWREQAPPTETFKSANAKFTVIGLKDVWDKNPNPKDLDENGVLYLFGRFLKEKDNRKNASFQVFTFENKGDLKEAMKKAREYLANKVKNENENYKLELATDVTAGQTEQGSVEDVGNRKGRMVDLVRSFNDEKERYFLLAVVTEGDLGYGILGDCKWDNRQIWRQDFLDVMRSLKFKKAD